MTPFNKLPDEDQALYYEAAHKILCGLHHCGRAWEAWGVGTMTEDDFTDACDNEDVLDETAEYLYEFSRARVDAEVLGGQ
jgi:hypothetical protein